MAKIFPRRTRVATFTAFETYQQQGLGEWVRDASRQSVHEIINDWLDRTHAEIQDVSAPGVSMYSVDADTRFVVMSVTVLYVSSAERTEDECRAPGNPVGPMDGSV